jgi:hypothetical protein
VTDPRDPAAPGTGPGDAGTGWYLYGITRHGLEQSAIEGPDESAPAQVLRCGELAAIMRPVSLAEFGPEALQARAGDGGWIEAVARSHNHVISSIHQRRAILPAKFGSIYLHAEDVLSALERDHDALLARLARLEGCDEWAVHLYADRSAVEQGAGSADESVRQLEQQLATAPRGRAYFLQRKLAEVRASAVERALSEIASEGYDRLARLATDSQIRSALSLAENAEGEVVALRAAFLVRRDSEDAFTAEVSSFAEVREGVRFEVTGPWPPYSFAAPEETSP